MQRANQKRALARDVSPNSLAQFPKSSFSFETGETAWSYEHGESLKNLRILRTLRKNSETI